MTLYDAVQWLIIGGAAAFSALYMLGRLAPGLRARAAAYLSRSTNPRLSAVGVKMAGSGGGCGSGCSSCNSCGTGTANSSEKSELISSAK